MWSRLLSVVAATLLGAACPVGVEEEGGDRVLVWLR